MRNIFSNNYLLIVDLFLRVVLAILLPKVFNPAILATYNYILALFFWFMILDLGSSQGFSLRVIRRYNFDSVNFTYIISSFLFSFILSSILIVVYFSISNDFLIINFPNFFLTYLSLLFYSFLTTIFRSLGLFKIDSIAKIIVSLVMIILVLFNRNLVTYFYILIPYLLGSFYLFYVFCSKINFFFKKTKSFLSIGIYNIKSGFNLYLINSLLIIFPLMDKVVFSKIILIENYGNYIFSYSLSSLHILVQSQITNKYYRLLLSEKITENNKKLTVLIFSIFFHIILFAFIVVIINLDIFKTFYSNYRYINQYIITTEFICISISILSLLYLIINSGKVIVFFLILCYFIPFTTFSLYKFNLIDNTYFWIFVYIIELLLAFLFLFKKFFTSFRYKFSR
jgi:O-antigen/teichoic acid export membrane protein